jgi:hypothetical protein
LNGCVSTSDYLVGSAIAKKLHVNGLKPDRSQYYSGDNENICKGGFRFVTSRRFGLEHRIKAIFIFPHGYSQETSGCICYCNAKQNNGVYAVAVPDKCHEISSNVINMAQQAIFLTTDMKPRING